MTHKEGCFLGAVLSLTIIVFTLLFFGDSFIY